MQLDIYDFDKTLFRSPEKPEGWKNGWWGHVESLSPPCVPEQPSHDWWVASTVHSAKQSISNPNVYAVLLTGRHVGFTHRISTLLRQAGLGFKEVRLARGGDTLSFKCGVIQDLLTRLSPDRVEMWEDREVHVNAFKQFLGGQGVGFEVHYVTATPKEAEGPLAARITKQFLDAK